MTAVARRNESVVEVLRMWSSAPMHDWKTLRALKERIAVGGAEIVLRDPVTRIELGRFDESARRKGGGSMTLEEAHRVIERLIRRWLQGLQRAAR